MTLPNQVSAKFEYVITCQIYGELSTALTKPNPKKTPQERCDMLHKAQCIDELRRQFSRNLRVGYVDTQVDGQVFSCLLGIDPISGADRTLFKVS